jgi:hypothetical protein
MSTRPSTSPSPASEPDHTRTTPTHGRPSASPQAFQDCSSGVNNTVRQLGSVLGIAATTALMAVGTDPLAGIHLAMVLSIGILVLAALSLTLTRPRHAACPHDGHPAMSWPLVESAQTMYWSWRR